VNPPATYPTRITVICERGHRVAAPAVDDLDLAAPPRECATCGATAIALCPHCRACVRERVDEQGLPLRCLVCGQAYPWTGWLVERAIRTVSEIGSSERARIVRALDAPIETARATDSLREISRRCGLPDLVRLIHVVHDVPTLLARFRAALHRG